MIETPYSDRLATLKQRLQKHPGRDKLRDQVSTLKAKNQGYKANQPAPVPYSGAYDSTMATLGQTLASTQADLAGQGLALEQQYGFGGDTSNPYSVARQLERKSQIERQGINTSLFASGQGYSGAYNNALNSQAYNAGQEQDAALRDYLARKASLASQGTQAQTAYSTGANEAYAQKLQDALNQPPDPAEAAGTGGGSGGGGGGQKGNQGGGGQGGGNQQQQERDRKERERKQKEEDDRRRGEYNRTHEHGKPIKKGKGK